MIHKNILTRKFYTKKIQHENPPPQNIYEIILKTVPYDDQLPTGCVGWCING